MEEDAGIQWEPVEGGEQHTQNVEQAQWTEWKQTETLCLWTGPVSSGGQFLVGTPSEFGGGLSGRMRNGPVSATKVGK